MDATKARNQLRRRRSQSTARTRVGGSASALACLTLGACSAFVGSRQAVTLDGGHPQTRILVDGDHVGEGKVSIELDRDRSHVVIFERAGAQDVHVVDHVWSVYGKLDVVGSILLLFPGIGLLCPGARSLEPRELQATLPGVE